MNDKETYGIELELITKKFSQKIDEIKSKVKQFGQDLNFSLTVKKSDVERDIEQVKARIRELQEEARHIQIYGGGDLPRVKAELGEAVAYLKDSEQELARFNSLGAKTVKTFTDIKSKVSEIGSSIKSKLIDKLKSFKNSFSISNLLGGLKGKTGNFGDTIKNSFSKGIASIKRFSIALLGVRGIYGLLTKAVRSYLSEHEGIANQLKAMFSGLGNLLAPIIEYVINLFSKLLAYANQFIKILTGVDLFARGMKSVAKSSKSTASSMNKIKGSLAGIDEITNISSDDGSGSGGAGSPGVAGLPSVDIGPIEKVADKIKEIFSKIFEPFKLAWNDTKNEFLNSVLNMATNVKGLFSSIGKSFLDVWTNGTGQKIIGQIILYWSQLFNIIGNVSKAIKHAWENNESGKKIIQSISNIFSTILSFALSIGDSIVKWTASEGFQNALDRIMIVLSDIFGYAEDIVKWVLGMYNKYLKPVIDDTLLPALDSIITAIGDIWIAIKPVIDKTVENVKKILEPVVKNLSGVIKGIITVVKGVADFISGVFTGDWKKAWNGIKTIFSGVWTTMKNAFKSVVNAMIGFAEVFANAWVDAINGIKKLLNKINIKIPDWIPGLGGKSWSPNLAMSSKVKLPRLNVGTPYVESSGLAYLHQGEAVVPEKFNDKKYFGNSEETNDLLRELITTLEEKDTSTYLDGRVIGEVAKNYINSQSRMLGRSVI